MGEREPTKEIINKGELFFLYHHDTEDTFSGYGLAMTPGSKEFLVGLVVVDRPNPVNPAWLKEVEEKYGNYQLVPMTTTGERGIACQMQIEPNSLPYLRKYPGEKATSIQKALEPFLENLPNPLLTMRWNEDDKSWRSHLTRLNELSPEIRQAFEKTGYGCLAAETNVGIVHVCHAPDSDIQGFIGKPVLYQWQLIKMPSAPLIRLEMTIVDNPLNPFKFESFLNVANEDQAKVLTKMADQDKLHLAFYGDDLNYRFTKVVNHDEQQWQLLDELVIQAHDYLTQIPADQQNFDRAKAEFMKRS